MLKKLLSVIMSLTLVMSSLMIPYLTTSAAETEIKEVCADIESAETGFSQRTTPPPTSSSYYYNSSYNPFYSARLVTQCTWYAWGRAYELMGKRPNFSTNHAGYWYDYNKNNGVYPYSNNFYAARQGAVLCCGGGKYGHVAIVEEVAADGSPSKISEGGWTGSADYTANFNYADGYYGEQLKFHYGKNWNGNFQGYIYLDGANSKGHVMSESEGAGKTIPDGDYWIGSKIDEDFFIDIPGNDFNTYNKHNVQTWRWSLGLPPIYDVFHLTYLNNGFYKIIQMNTRMVIDVYEGNLDRGSNVSMWEDTGSTAQQWSIEKTDGGYKIRSRGNSYYMDIYDGKHENGTNVLTWENHDGNNQFFSFIPYSPEERPVSDGIYKISSAISDTCFLDVHGGFDDFKNLSNIEAYNSPDDSFQLEYAGNGYYHIYESTSLLSLEVINDGDLSYLNNCRNVILYGKNNRKNQLWKIIKNDDETYSFVNQLSGYYLDLENAKTDNGTNVSQYQYNGYKNQKWKLHRVLNKDMVSIGDLTQEIGVTNVNPDVVVKADSHTLTENEDYIKAVVLDIPNGKGTVTITGINDYIDSVVMEFYIQTESFVLGDVDGDGEVTIIDATLIQRRLANMDVPSFNETAADINDDGLDITDATMIQRHLAMMSVPYPIGEVIN